MHRGHRKLQGGHDGCIYNSMTDVCREIARDCLALQARRLERTLTRIYDRALADVGVTGSQLSLLVALALLGETTAARLGAVLELEKSTVSRNVARLVDAGLVDARDGLRLAPRAADVIRAGHKAWRRAQRQARAELGANPLRLLESLSKEARS
jgi:DNA-binding MarR family transcriptional regulator